MMKLGGKIPFSVYPTFWIFAALIGYVNSGSLVGIVIWMGVIFVSVLFHELGHALTALLWGRYPRIELVALGGLTYHDGERLPLWKQFMIVFNGPLFGFFLFLIATFLLGVPLLQQGLMGTSLVIMQGVNLIWTVLNLLPILPLDGGQLLRITLTAFFGPKALRYTLLISFVFALLISLTAFLFNQMFFGAFLFLFAFQSFTAWKQSRS